MASNRPRLPLSFFHQVPSPPCFTPAKVPSRAKPPLVRIGTVLSADDCEGFGDGVTAEDDGWLVPGASAIGLHQDDEDAKGGGGRVGRTRAAEAESLPEGEEGAQGAGKRGASGRFCVWRHCVVKGREEAEGGATGGGVVVEWDDAAGGQVRPVR